MVVVLMGMKYKGAAYGALNITNHTSIRFALEVIRGAEYFIGLDGFLAYVAMSFGIPATVIYHEARLLDHYVHPAWAENSKILVGPQRISNTRKILEN